MVFTGIVQATGKANWNNTSHVLTVTTKDNFFHNSKSGDSIAINGVCLTLVQDPSPASGQFFIMNETLSKTSFKHFEDNLERHVNLEKALSLGEQLGGHKVLGHVHGVATIIAIHPSGDGSKDVWVDITSPSSGLGLCIVHKGSICLDGISLTVAELNTKDGRQLVRVSLIPYTLSHTTLGIKNEGDLLNVEFDHDLLTNKSTGANNWSSTEQGQPYDMKKEQEQIDEYFMLETIALAEKGRLTTAPNPWVGCILVAKGTKSIIGRGYHKKAGQPHAEVLAVQDAIDNGNEPLIAGCTAYVSLEPCHHHGRTPPCDQKLLAHKVGRVVVALVDPDERVAGKGLEFLGANGVEVKSGVCVQQAAASLAAYLRHRSSKRPFCVCKVALSLDGRLACQDGTSQWITNELARADAHMLRARSQAILVGTGTALADKPRLTVRIPGLEVTPLRVLLDTKGRVIEGPLLDLTLGPTLIFTTEAAPVASREIWKQQGVEVQVISVMPDGLINLEQVLDELGRRGVLQLLIEGGAKVHSEFLLRGLVDELVVYQGSCILGGTALPWISSPVTSTISQAKFWKLTRMQQFEDNVCLVYGKQS
jgi:diaminohydroxyphosphoribosylaminopyrimidine deaminase/5-amino-6-(5-phosphoribosylamino)uracil reductase